MDLCFVATAKRDGIKELIGVIIAANHMMKMKCILLMDYLYVLNVYLKKQVGAHTVDHAI